MIYKEEHILFPTNQDLTEIRKLEGENRLLDWE